MTYVDPTTRITGELITAPIWNQDVVANVQAIYANLSFGFASGDVTDIINSTTETTCFSDTLVGGRLGLKNALIFEARGTLNNPGTRTTTFRAKLGATALLTLAFTTGSTASQYKWKWTGMIKNDEATNAQLAFSEMLRARTADVTFGEGSGSGVEDTTGDLTLALTMQNSAADYTSTFEWFQAWLFPG